MPLYWLECTKIDLYQAQKLLREQYGFDVQSAEEVSGVFGLDRSHYDDVLRILFPTTPTRTGDRGINTTPQCSANATGRPYSDVSSSHTTKSNRGPNPNISPIVLLPRLQEVYKSKHNTPHRKTIHSKAPPPPVAAPVNSPPPFIFDAESIHSAQKIIAGHLAGLIQTTTDIEKKKALFDEAMNNLDEDLDNLLVTIEEQAKLAQ